MPMLLTVADVADLLRTTRRAIYAMLERGQLPGVIRIRRHVLIRHVDADPSAVEPDDRKTETHRLRCRRATKAGVGALTR
jgi:excisionase family DNA binding protein